MFMYSFIHVFSLIHHLCNVAPAQVHYSIKYIIHIYQILQYVNNFSVLVEKSVFPFHEFVR